MRASGVICEFNPFHTGHAYLLSRMRELVGEEGLVVCAMSGRFVQRGEAAMADPYLRAETALSGGADLVVELPLPFSAASARQFAAGGVAVLAGLGCVDTLCFGAEAADVELLTRLAALLDTEDFARTLKQQLDKGVSWPAARAAAAEAALPGAAQFLAGPNNILALAYLQAMKEQNAPFAPLPVARQGAGHDSMVPAEGFASASYLRLCILCLW